MSMQREMIKAILARPAAGGQVTVAGWARAVRAQKQVVFIQVNDGSCLADLQLVVRPDHPQFERLGRLSQGAGLKAVGVLEPSAGAGQK
jgi:asparaginyl-tRNA synthetase